MKTPIAKNHNGGRAFGKRQAAKVGRSAAKRGRAKPGRARLAGVSSAADQKRPTGKLGRVLDAITAKRGASLDELVELTGWQPHTARAALTRLRQRGFQIGHRETDGRKAYHHVAAASQ